MRSYGFGYSNLRRRSALPQTSAIARKAKHSETPTVSGGESVREVASTGRPLEASTREFMGTRFGHDFSGVRVHTGTASEESASRLEARAFTFGSDVAFGSGEYAPGTARGQHLLAHELAHVVQNNRGRGSAEGVSSPGDRTEIAADRAASNVFSARGDKAEVGGEGGAAFARQTIAATAPSLGPKAPSQGETIVESFLRKMWVKQSGGTGEFRVTPKVLEGLNLIFPFGAPVGPITIYPSPDALMARLLPSIPSTIDPNIMKVLDRLPSQEKKLSDAAKKDPDADPASPKFLDVPGAPKAPETSKGYSDAAEAALKQAYEQFSKTELGKQLEKSLKSYVLSVEGIPFDVLVAGGVLTFIAVDDPKLPSPPPIPLGNGVKLKIDISGRAEDLPPLLRDMVHGHSTQPQQPGTSETKVAVGVTMTNDAMIAMAKAVGHFFAEAASWFAKGVIHIGTVIGRAGIHLGRALLAAAGGAALGALIGGLTGGGIGALIGAGAGALFAAGASLIGDLLSKKKSGKKKEQTV